MNGHFTAETFDSIAEDWRNLETKSQSSHVFSSLVWTKGWWQLFSAGNTLYIGAVRKQDEVIGIAPLMVNKSTASFIGSVNVCDYLDFLVLPGEEDYFFEILLENLTKKGIINLDFAPLRPDSVALTHLDKIARERNIQSSTNKIDVSLDLELPSDWETYLLIMNTKQRHELKRKLRRLSEMGEVSFRASLDANEKDVSLFLKLFQDSREDKAAFLTPEMETFFRSQFAVMAASKMFRLNVLELNSKPIAATVCFDYRDTMYLYNSGYDPEHRWLSAGLLSKAMCIKESISLNKKRFDFLKGNEEYKYHLGGKEFPVYRYVISLPG